MNNHLQKSLLFIIIKWIISRITDTAMSRTIMEDLEYRFIQTRDEKGRLIAAIHLLFQILIIIQPFIIENFIGGFTMFKNYLKIAFRNIKKHKGFSLINITGLALGIAVCTFILLYVQFELSYDRYHPNYDRIYRVSLSSKAPVGEDKEPANTPLLATTLLEQYPQVEAAARFTQWSGAVITKEQTAFQETGVYYTEPELFTIFSIPFIEGDPNTSLKQPGKAVITEGMSAKYFGDINPIGKMLPIRTTIDTREYQITGVIKNPPANTHFKYHILLSLETVKDNDHLQGQHNLTITYIKLRQGTDAQEFESSIKSLSHKLMQNKDKKSNIVYTNFLQPVADIHLHSHLSWEIGPSGNSTYLLLFSAIGLLILCIACINFMNLSTARSAARSCEVGMRKVVGAFRSQLIKQFLSESVIMALISSVLAIILVTFFLPFFNNLANTEFIVQDLLQIKIISGLFLLILFTGIIGGSYSAFFLSAFKPISVLKGHLKSDSGSSDLRKILVICQFTISITLIIATLAVYKQLSFMKSQSLGFAKEQKLVIPIKRGETVRDKYKVIKAEFLKDHKVISATASSSVPGRGMNVWWTWPDGEEKEKKQLVNCLHCDYDFISEYDLEIIAGRSFQEELRSDSSNGAIIINETTVNKFGWNSPEEALGKYIWDNRVPVIGVCKDFHWQGLKYEIEPLTLMIWPNNYRYITLTVHTNDLQETIKTATNVYTKWFPDHPLDYFFLDTEFNLQYRSEENLGRIFSTFTFLGIFIACMGLFGMASFTAERRTKEIGIRKVLGASVTGIIAMLSKDFTKWIFLANFLAWPIAYFTVSKWLQNFAYRINIDLMLFIYAAFLTFLISMLTVSYQSIRAAVANPINSIKYE